MRISSAIQESIRDSIDFSKDKDYNINVIASAIFQKDFSALKDRHKKQVLKYYEDNYDRNGSW